MNFCRLALIALSFIVFGCSNKNEENETDYRRKLNNNWIEIKRSNLAGGLYSTYGERYKADWLMFVDDKGFATIKTPKNYYRNIFVRPDSIIKWEKYKYRIIKLKTDTMVLEFIPNKNDNVNKPHHLMFVSEKVYKKIDKTALEQLQTLSKKDTLFLEKLLDSCKKSPDYFFSAEKMPFAKPLEPYIKIDTLTSDDGRLEFKIIEQGAEVKYDHLYSGKFIVRENGKISNFDVGLMTWGGEEIHPDTYKYIKQFIERKIRFEAGTTLGVKHNSFVYFTFMRTAEIKG